MADIRKGLVVAPMVLKLAATKGWTCCYLWLSYLGHTACYTVVLDSVNDSMTFTEIADGKRSDRVTQMEDKRKLAIAVNGNVSIKRGNKRVAAIVTAITYTKVSASDLDELTALHATGNVVNDPFIPPGWVRRPPRHRMLKTDAVHHP